VIAIPLAVPRSAAARIAASAVALAAIIVAGSDPGLIALARGTAQPAGVVSTELLIGAGDIGDCQSTAAEATARLLERSEATVFTAGDNAYDSGTVGEFTRCYAPTWGRYRARTRPALGNHDYVADGQATAYFSYFGAAAGDPARGYYSYDLGPWHIVVLNSNCARIGGCVSGSAQERWLREDLEAHRAFCTLAIWHHPLFSSGSEHGATAAVQPLWIALEEAGAEVVINGHDHDYERFAPQSAQGVADPVRGIREFVVGTGGAPLRRLAARAPNSEAADGGTFGVLLLTLRADGYDWRFLGTAGSSFSDAGTDRCH